MKLSLMILLGALSMTVFAAAPVTTSTSSAGTWNTSGNWDNGVPTSIDEANIDHALVIDANISTTKGDFTFSATATDAPGGSAYTLTISGTGSDDGTVDVDKNVTFEGALAVNGNGVLYVRGGDTLMVGGATFANGSTVQIDFGGVLVVNGDLVNNNNSTGITINGKVIVNGNVSGGNGSEMTGIGSISSTGTMSTTGSGTIFGSGDNCSTGPCSGSPSGVGPLPVVLLYLDLHEDNATNEVTLSWGTALEIGNDYFEIQKSYDLETWGVVGSITGQGDSEGLTEYSWIDPVPVKSVVHYYRLVQVDFDGARTEYDAISHDANSGFDIEIDAGQSCDFFWVNHQYIDLIEGIEVYDQQGTLVMQDNFETRGAIVSLNSLVDGTYIVRLIYGPTREYFSTRIVKYTCQ